MKMNYKMFKNINLEPVDVQEFENNKVEIYNLEETPYFTQYAMRGRFSVWTGDGQGNYKVLIEKGYREESGRFYNKEVNQIWVNFFDQVDKANKKGFRLVMLPAIFVLLVV